MAKITKTNRKKAKNNGGTKFLTKDKIKDYFIVLLIALVAVFISVKYTHYVDKKDNENEVVEKSKNDERVARSKLDKGARKISNPNTDKKLIEMALTDFKEGMQKAHPNKYPDTYYKLLNCQGGCYLRLSKLIQTERNLILSKNFFNDALDFAHDINSKYYIADSNLNLSHVYYKHAEIRNQKDNCTMSISTCQQALSFFTEDKYDYKYSYGKIILALAHLRLGAIEDPKTNYSLAMQYINDVLLVVSPEKYEQLYHCALGVQACAHLGIKTIDKDYLNCTKAIKNLQEALNYVDVENDLDEYIQDNNNLANAYIECSRMKETTFNIKKAINLLKMNMSLIDKKGYPGLYSDIQLYLGIAYMEMIGSGDDEKNIRRALKIFDDIKTFYTAKEYPLKHADLLLKIGQANYWLAMITKKEKYILTAIEEFGKYIEILGDNNKIPSAKSRTWLAGCYEFLGSIHNNAHYYNQSITEYNIALKVLSFENCPDCYISIQQHLGQIYGILAKKYESKMYYLKAIEANKNAFRMVNLKEYNKQTFADLQLKNAGFYISLSCFWDTQANLNNAYGILNNLKFQKKHLKYPDNLINYHGTLGYYYFNLAKIKNPKQNLKLSLSELHTALDICKKENLVNEQKNIRKRIDEVYQNLASLSNSLIQ